jgi:hypothetical protein
MDPHKRSATIEILNDREQVLGGGRFGTDRKGYRQMLSVGREYSDSVWAVEGCNGIARHLAQRLVADGELVVDVPATLSARARVFSTGQGRKSDPVDAHSVALVGLRSTRELRVIAVDDATVALRLLIDRRGPRPHQAGLLRPARRPGPPPRPVRRAHPGPTAATRRPPADPGPTPHWRSPRKRRKK